MYSQSEILVNKTAISFIPIIVYGALFILGLFLTVMLVILIIKAIKALNIYIKKETQNTK